MNDFLKNILVAACGAVALHHSCAFAQMAKPGAGTTVVGAGAAYVPGYYGSRDEVLVPAVFAEHTFSNGMFLSTLRGVGYDTTVNNIELGAALRYASGRTDSRNTIATHSGSDDLRGMGDVPNYLATDLHAYVPLGGKVTAMFTAQLALNHRDNGNSYKIGLSSALFQNHDDSLVASLDAQYGDSKHARTYFGVNQVQSANSGYPAYVAKAGFEHAMADLTWAHKFDENWSVWASGGVIKMLNNAKSSPLTRKAQNPFLATTLNYAF